MSTISTLNVFHFRIKVLVLLYDSLIVLYSYLILLLIAIFAATIPTCPHVHATLAQALEPYYHPYLSI